MKPFSDREVRWGVLGAGDVCEVKSVPAMSLVDDSRVVAVMRRDADKAADFARRHGVPRWYADADELLDDPAVNAVYVATPPHVHGELALRALARGKPVYVEKPMARSYPECEEMVTAAESAGIPLYVAYYRRRLPNFEKLRQLLLSRAIGQIRYVRIVLNQEPEPDLVSRSAKNWRVDPAIAGGGYFHDLASHQFDLLDYLLGPIRDAAGATANQGGRYAADDMVTAAFEFQSGILGSGSWCFTAAGNSVCDSTTIFGSEGQIEFPTFGAGTLRLDTANGRQQVFDFDLPAHIQQPLIETVVDDLLGRGRCPSTGRSGARASRVMDAVCAGLPQAAGSPRHAG